MSQRSQHPDRRSLRARWVFPLAGAPIANGIVEMAGGRIVAVRGKPLATPPEDLGNVAIVPGLVNAHTHLEFSHLDRPLGEPGIALVEWIRRVIELRRRGSGTVPISAGQPTSLTESTPCPRQWGCPLPMCSPIELGLQQSARLGTTALAEIAQVGWPVELFQQTRLDATVFLELIAPTAARVPAALTTAQEHVLGAEHVLGPALPTSPHAGWRPGLSPHAPYSVHPQLLAKVVALSAKYRVPLAMHLAESREELQLLQSGDGPLRDLLEQLDAWQPDAMTAGKRPLDYLRTLASADRALIVHGNYLEEDEISFLGAHAEKMSVVYCPRTHAFFRHAAYPLEKMLAAGVAVALGTDSRASSPDLSVLAEMRAAAARHPTVGGEMLLRMATLHGAAALGLAEESGSLEPGKTADLTIVALPDHDAADPHDLLLKADLPVVATWRRGVEVPAAAISS